MAVKIDKASLMSMSIDKLKSYNTKFGSSLTDPKTGKAKTKEQLANSILMKVRLTGDTNKSLDAQRLAKSPGKRVSKSGKVYNERRANRADVNKRTMLGEKKMTATDVKAKEFKMHLTQLNKVANEIIKARGTKEIAGLRKQLSGEMRSCRNCYSAFLSKAK